MFRNKLVQFGSVVTAALLGVMLLGVGGTTAATPGWSAAASSIPGTVSPGSYALYRVTVTNGGSSNISQLFLTSDQAAVPFSATPSAGSCTANVALSCSLGALASGATDTILVVYKTPSNRSSLDIDFQFNTSGSTGSDQKHHKPTSHGDTLHDPVSTALDGSANFAGGYVVFGGTSFSTATGDIQQTTVNSPTTGIPVTITESTGTGTSECGSGSPIGQLVTLNVADGADTNGEFLTTLTIKTSAIDDEAVLSDVSFCHRYGDDAVGTLLTRCETDSAPASGACFFPKWSGTVTEHGPEAHNDADDADNHLFLVIDVWDVQNGSLRGQLG